jgi:GNAT superfamily N-acetyltransferase
MRWATPEDATSVCRVVNAAYKELAEQGLNYTGATQDVEVTRERMQKGRTLLLLVDTDLVGTIHVQDLNRTCARKCAYIGQFGVLPSHRSRGLGRLMMDFIEAIVRDEGYEITQLDTAKPARRLIEMYLRRGYRIISEIQFKGKNYQSWIFEKELRVAGNPI